MCYFEVKLFQRPTSETCFLKFDRLFYDFCEVVNVLNNTLCVKGLATEVIFLKQMAPKVGKDPEAAKSRKVDIPPSESLKQPTKLGERYCIFWRLV